VTLELSRELQAVVDRMPPGSVVVISGSEVIPWLVAGAAHSTFTIGLTGHSPLDGLLPVDGVSWVDHSNHEPVVRGVGLQRCEPSALADECHRRGVSAIVLSRQREGVAVYFGGRRVAVIDAPA
jgi:hypothetical protein